VLVLILCVVHAAIRRSEDPAEGETMTAADLITAMRLLRQVEGERMNAGTAAAFAADDGVVTALAARGGKKE
jgi:hypothetical protein